MGLQRPRGALPLARARGHPRELADHRAQQRHLSPGVLAPGLYGVVVRDPNHLHRPEDAHPQAGLRGLDPAAIGAVPGDNVLDVGEIGEIGGIGSRPVLGRRVDAQAGRPGAQGGSRIGLKCSVGLRARVRWAIRCSTDRAQQHRPQRLNVPAGTRKLGQRCVHRSTEHEYHCPLVAAARAQLRGVHPPATDAARRGETVEHGLLALGQVEIGDGAFERLGRHPDRLRERRVRMDGQADVGGVGAHLDR